MQHLHIPCGFLVVSLWYHVISARFCKIHKIRRNSHFRFKLSVPQNIGELRGAHLQLHLRPMAPCPISAEQREPGARQLAGAESLSKVSRKPVFFLSLAPVLGPCTARSEPSMVSRTLTWNTEFGEIHMFSSIYRIPS